MPTYHVQQTWRAKRPKTVVSRDLEIHLNLPKTNSPKVVVRSVWLQRERKDDVIWSDLKLGATSNLTQFYLKVEVK